MRSLFLFFLLLLFILPAYSQLQGNTGKGNIYALVVGIANYENKDIPQLQYSNRDAVVFAEYLRSKAGGSVPAENIQLLIDSAATTGAVYDGIYWLLKTCSKDDLVFIYFSGHGDIENANIHKNGYLICYDSPAENYPKNALSVAYLNTIANTLSAQTLANVVLITDACHSGKLAGSSIGGTFMVSEELRNIQKKEIRLTSSAENQLSNENKAWGDGRGVFSFYLIEGLKGVANKNKDSLVTLDEIRSYLDSCFHKDALLKKENIVQTPVLKGRGDFQLAKVDPAMEMVARKVFSSMPPQLKTENVSDIITATLPANAQEYFFQRLKEESLEGLTDSLQLNAILAEAIPFTIIKYLEENSKTPAQINKLTELENKLLESEQALLSFNSKLAVAFDKAGQKVINLYLKADEAEMEKRRYYNANNNGYDVYVRMFAVALKLVTPDNGWHTILEVKLHYFTGVALRLKIPVAEDPKLLIEKALSEQKKALALADDAAYVYNELGVLYGMKKNMVEEEKYYLMAIEKAPTWVIPHVNLMGLYTEQKKYVRATEEYEIAKRLQPGFQGLNVSAGQLYAKQGDLLFAEESFRKGIDQNSRHYLPFERLGYIYTNTTQYALADSFFYEAAERKKGFHFAEYDELNHRNIKLPKIASYQVLCIIDSLNFNAGENNVFWHLIKGLQFYRAWYNDINALSPEESFKKVIALDKKNPLAFHYLGRYLFEMKRWQEAEIILKMALDNYLPKEDFQKYYDSCQSTNELLYYTCADSLIRYSQYKKEEDQYLLAMVYENWNHLNEAEAVYRKIIEEDTTKGLEPYVRSSKLLENAGRYQNAEKLLLEYAFYHSYLGKNELNAFYHRMIERSKGKTEWYYKAGNLLFDLAQDDPGLFISDKKMIDEQTDSAIFVIPEKIAKKWPRISQDIYILPPAYTPPDLSTAIIHPFTEGINYLSKAAEGMQDDDDALADISYKIGDLYMWQELPRKAFPYYVDAVKLKPANAGLRLKLIDAYAVTYHYQDALEQLDTLYRRKEINVSQQLLMAKYYLQSGRFDTAQTLLNDVEKIHPYAQPEIIELNGRLQLLAGHPAEAISYYKKLLAIYPKDSCIIYSIARLYAKLGKINDARKWLDLAINSGFNYSFVLRFDPYLEGLRNTEKWKWLNAAIKEAIDDPLSNIYPGYTQYLKESKNWNKFIK